MAGAYDGSLPMPLVALEYLSVLDGELQNPFRSVGASDANCADPDSVCVPEWVLGALADAWESYVGGERGTTLTDAFVGKASKQGQRAHSPAAIRKRARDFTLTWRVISACTAPGVDRPETLEQAFKSVALSEELDEKTVAEVYRRNLLILRPYLESVGAPIVFPD